MTALKIRSAARMLGGALLTFKARRQNARRRHSRIPEGNAEGARRLAIAGSSRRRCWTSRSARGRQCIERPRPRQKPWCAPLPRAETTCPAPT